jgi:peptidoglycan DL-endopeptidase CwlO
MNTQTKTLAIVSSILLSASFAGPAKASEPTEPTTQELQLQNASQITAKATQKVEYERPAVKTVKALAPAPVVDEHPVVVQETPEAVQAPVAVPAPVSVPTPVQAPVAVPVQKAAEPTPAPKPAAPKVSASGKGASIAAAAYAQIGVSQDCTALATNSLAAVGINFHDWPAGYMSLGTIVPASEAQPGDLAYYANGGMGLAHIAVYVGNGQAIHGGWNGGTTALFSVNVGSGPVFIRVA